MISLKIPNSLNFGKQMLVSFTFFFLPLFLFDAGLNGLQIGVLMSIFTFVSLFSSFPIGIINDRLSIKYVIVFGFLLESVFFAGLYIFTDFLTVIPFFIAGALGGNMIDTSIRSMTFKALAPKKRGKKLGVYQLFSSVGFGTGIVLGGVLLDAFNFSGVMLITAAAFLAMALVSYLITETKKEKFPLSAYKSILLGKGTIAFLIPLFLFGIHWGAEHTSYSLFLREELGLGFISSGLYMGVPIILLGFISLLGGLRTDKVGIHSTIFFCGLILSGIGHIFMVYPLVSISFMFRLIHEIGDGLAMVSYYVSFSRIFKLERIGGEASAAHTFMVMGAVLGSLVFGPLGNLFGYYWPFIISGIITLMATMILFLFRKNAGF